MAIGSSRKSRANKRSSLNKSITPSMPSSSSSFSSPFRHYRKLSFIIPAFLMLVTVVILLRIQLNAFHSIGSGSNQLYSIRVINEFPHDPKAFTQGLLYGGNDTLFESTGLYERSSVRSVDLHSGKIVALQKLSKTSFGEGLTLLGERLYQVTWLENTGFIYDRNNLSNFQKFTHDMQDGWGLATDGKVLFGTDGTSTLYHIDPRSLKVIRKHVVKYKGHEVHNLNELEYVNDEVWANIWQTDCIARISPEDGVVREWILLHSLREGLLAAGRKDFDVLNGIAWDREKDRLFVTGKLWPKLYEIKLHPIRKHFHGAIEDICMPVPFQFAKP